MMRVFYGMQSGHAHRYQCFGDDGQVKAGLCIGIGGLRVDRAVAAQVLEAVSAHAVEAAVQAAEQVSQGEAEVRSARGRELEDARYEALWAERRYEAVDPAKRLVAREWEARWNAALERVAEREAAVTRLEQAAAARAPVDRAALLALAQDLPTA